MNPDSKYPVINPVLEGVERPFWSVMIPTYNCANYLVKTLKSVLTQDPGSEKMQIEVIDDCSSDDPETVVKEIGKGRVSFYRQSQNGGAIKNFNTCIERSLGYYIHILHGDDYVSPDFYASFSQLIATYPEVSFLTCRSFVVNEADDIIDISPLLKALETPRHDASFAFYNNPFFTPGIVIKRSFYEQFGGFCEILKHTADWEMWIRSIEKSSGIATNSPLAFYRLFQGNDTSRLVKTGDNIRDYWRLKAIFSETYQNFDQNQFAQEVKAKNFRQYLKFLYDHDQESALNNLLLWWELLLTSEKMKYLLSCVKIDKVTLKTLFYIGTNFRRQKDKSGG